MSGINFIQPTHKSKLYNIPFRYDNILSGQIGKLIPIQCDEVNAKEYWRQNISFLLRMAPLSAPAMAKMNVCFYSFFIPSRILTPRNSQNSTWEQFICSIGKVSQENDTLNIPVLPSMYTSSSLYQETYTDAVKAMLKEKFSIGSLSDYLDYPVASQTEIDSDNLFNIPYNRRLLLFGYLCYQMVYDWWFRRDQIEEPIQFPLAFETLDLANIDNSEMTPPEEWEGTESEYKQYFFDELFKLRTKNYERDYFTSALPTPQYGEDVTIGDGLVSFLSRPSISGAFDLYSLNTNTTPSTVPRSIGVLSGNPNNFQFSLFGKYVSPMLMGESQESAAGARNWGIQDKQDPSFQSFYAKSHPNSAEETGQIVNGLGVDMESLSAVANTFTINEFRLGMQLQAVKEAINRGGTRYIEIMQNVYDAIVPDARLQQPVYLGGIKCPVQIGTVVQSSETTATTPLGTLAGKAQSASGGMLFKSKKPFSEHGFVLTIACVAPRTGYVGGTPRKWFKHDPLDYFNPYFAHLGEQTIMNGEIYNNPWDGQTDNDVLGSFGYQERYSEYRHAISRAHGEMRTQTKDNWHLFRIFDTNPHLSTDFIKMQKEDFDRIFEFETINGTSNEHFDLITAIDITKKTPVPKYGTPYSFI